MKKLFILALLMLAVAISRGSDPDATPVVFLSGGTVRINIMTGYIADPSVEVDTGCLDGLSLSFVVP
jgi:hypothetical protein